jgi:hypothetical protein
MNLIKRVMNSEEIKRLLEKYYEGATTLEEELLLKKFFSGEKIPPDLLNDKEIFRYYIQMTEIPEPSTDFEEKIFSAIGREDKNIAEAKSRRLFGSLSGIAAVMLILAGSYFFFTNRSEPPDTYSDPELAYAETMKILYEVSARLNHGTQALGQIGALQDETQKTINTLNRSTGIMKEKMKPLDNLFDAIGKAESNYQLTISK